MLLLGEKVDLDRITKKQLADLIHRWAGHQSDCRMMLDGFECTCGFFDELNTLGKARKPATASTCSTHECGFGGVHSVCQCVNCSTRRRSGATCPANRPHTRPWQQPVRAGLRPACCPPGNFRSRCTWVPCRQPLTPQVCHRCLRPLLRSSRQSHSGYTQSRNPCWSENHGYYSVNKPLTKADIPVGTEIWKAD